MVTWLWIVLGTLRSAVRMRRELALENLALRQQLAVWKASLPAGGAAGDGGRAAQAGIPKLLDMEEHSRCVEISILESVSRGQSL